MCSDACPSLLRVCVNFLQRACSLLALFWSFTCRRLQQFQIPLLAFATLTVTSIIILTAMKSNHLKKYVEVTSLTITDFRCPEIWKVVQESVKFNYSYSAMEANPNEPQKLWQG